MSITFVGFMVTSNGDLIDPAHRGGVLERGIMTHQLYTGLKAQRVNFDEDYRQWPKHEMIQKISTVMGIDWPYDPDQTYVLTVDNLIKILAIQMRFRYTRTHHTLMSDCGLLLQVWYTGGHHGRDWLWQDEVD